MTIQTKITVEQWHELPDEKKETVRHWAVRHGFGLDIVPSDTAETCDYAALLSTGQLKLLLGELTGNDLSPSHVPDDCNALWKEILKHL